MLYQAQQLPTHYVSTLSADVDVLNNSESINVINLREWRGRQRENVIIDPFLRAVTQKTKPKTNTVTSMEGKCILKDHNHFVVRRDVLYRQVTERDQEPLQLP